jgi:hypothetical protein
MAVDTPRARASSRKLVDGTYERLELSGLGGTAAIGAMLITPFMYAALLGIFTLALACGLFGVGLHWSTAALRLPIGVLGALALTRSRCSLARARSPTSRRRGNGALLRTLSLVAGLYFPVDLLPEWIGWMSKFRPLTPTASCVTR